HTRSKRDWSSDVCSSDLIWLRIEGRAGCPPQRFLGRELASAAVHVLAEPVAQSRELAPLDLLFEIADVVEELLPDLHGHDGSERSEERRVGKECRCQGGR